MLKIGDIEMIGLAAPENFPLGGEQEIVTHKLSGGGVVNQPRGYFPVLEYIWEGTFEGPDAHKKAAQLEKYCQSGKSVKVTFHTFSLFCFVQKFEWPWVRKDWIDFTIVLKRDLSPPPAIGTPTSSKFTTTSSQRTGPIAKVTPSPPPPPKQKTITHTVVKGEYLRKIAQRYYGDPDKYEKIYQDNRKVIGNNPNKIKPGQKLVIRL